MVEDSLSKFFVVMSIFVVTLLLPTVLVVSIMRLRLFNNTGLVVASVGISLIFGGSSFSLIMLSSKFSS